MRALAVLLAVVAAQGIVQRQTPDSVRGRVLAALSGAGLLANATGFVFAGFAVSALGPSGIYAVAAVAASAATLVLGSTLRQARLATYRMPVAWMRPASIASCSSASLVSARSEKRYGPSA